jgi:hypothetical protein
MRRLSLLFLLTAATASGFQKQAEQESAPFQWLSGSGETSGMKYETQKLHPVSLPKVTGPPVEIEQEVVQVDSQTTRVTRRSFSQSVNGGRVMTETVVEEIRRLPGDRVHAVRTTSRKDANGRFGPVAQDIQDTTPAGSDSFQTKRTLLVFGGNNALVEKEQIQQIEHRKSDKTVEIDRTRYLPGVNGSWTVAERRVSRNSTTTEGTRTEEQVYDSDVNNQLFLAEQLKVIESKDPGGQRRWQSETYTRNMEGKLQLGRRMTIIQKPLKDGRQETTQTAEEVDPAAQNQGLKLVQRIVENTQAVSPNQTERQLEVLEPDLDGRMRNVYTQESVEIK